MYTSAGLELGRLLPRTGSEQTLCSRFLWRHIRRVWLCTAGCLDVLARLLLQNQAAFTGALQATGMGQPAQVSREVLLGMFLDLWLDRSAPALLCNERTSGCPACLRPQRRHACYA